MLCTRHTVTNACPLEGLNVIVSLLIIIYVTVYINEKPPSARSGMICGVQSSTKVVAGCCLVLLRQCPRWLKQDVGEMLYPS